MRSCAICGESLKAGTRTCPMCGTTAPETTLVGEPEAPPMAVVEEATAAAPSCPPGMCACPSCGQQYNEDYNDEFCICGVELTAPSAAAPPAAPAPAVAPKSKSKPPPVPAPAPLVDEFADRPPAGTPCLVLYGGDGSVLSYFPLTKDAMLIGRLDAVAGNFPDIDLAEVLDGATARKVSRKHALVLRSRATKKFCLRPLAGNTGTQIEKDMVEPLSDYPLREGLRVILGGVVRMKFEVT